ncbi:MAG: helix-turn-helix transcriptional regulator [Polyangiaceae bacterium]
MATVLYQPFPMQGRGRGQIWRYAPQYRRPRHFHAEPELNVVCAGTGAFATGARVFPVRAGDTVWWPAGIDHELVGTSPDFDLFVVGLTPELSERVLGCAGLDAAPARALRLPAATFAAIERACAIPVHELEPLVLEQRVAELWHAAYTAPGAGVGMHTLARRGVLAVFADPEVTRRELARELRAHPSDVSRHFSADVGITLTEYRTRLRLLRFIRAVDEAPVVNLAAAALAAGFGSYSQCHRAFRAALACSPREFFTRPAREAMSEVFAPW